MTIGKFAALMAFIIWTLSACTHENAYQAADTPRPTGPYLGQTPPGTTPELFAPGLISTALHDDGAPRFSADGNEVYFRKWATPHDIIGVMKQTAGVWSEPELFKPLGKYVCGVPIIIPDTQRALFISRAPRSGAGDPADYNIWSSEKCTAGWTTPEYLDQPLNTSEDDFAYSVSAAGTIYLQAKYADTLGAYDIYYAPLVDGVYQKAINIGAPINTDKSESAPFIAPDESYLVYCAFDYEDSYGNIDLYVSFKMAGGTWSAAHNLGDQINTPAGEKFPAVSPDGKYLFYVGDQYPSRSYVFGEATYAELMEQNLGAGNGLGGDVYWVSTEVISKLGPVR